MEEYNYCVYFNPDRKKYAKVEITDDYHRGLVWDETEVDTIDKATLVPIEFGGCDVLTKFGYECIPVNVTIQK